MKDKKKIAVLVSGAGTNLQAIIDTVAQDQIPAKLALVISNRPGVKALERAEAAGVTTLCLTQQEVGSRVAYDKKLLEILQEAEIDIVVLAGFDRIVSHEIVQAYRHRLLNIHPALLPAFPGLHSVKQALDYGVQLTGVTVHFVDEGVDTGPIILQEAVSVLPNDSETSLLERLHEVEHRLYPEAIGLLVSGRLEIDGRTVRVL